MSLDISVVIPTYKGAPFIAAALESAFAQTLPPREIIVVDDCSPDDTLEVVARVAANSPVPVRTIRLPRNSGGPAGPLNAGIEAAQCDWVAILEHDDAMRADRLEQQAVALAESPQARFATGRAYRFGTDGDTSGFFWGELDQFAEVIDDATLAKAPKFMLAPRAAAFRVLLDRQFTLTNSSFLFHKSLWTEIGGFDPKVGACSDLAFALAAAVRSDFAIVNAPVIAHRLHEGSLNTRQNRMALVTADLLRMDSARRHSDLAGGAWRSIYWKLRMGRTVELWKNGCYRALARLVIALVRMRFSPEWYAKCS
jgi:glycosyltransferase involved in cell wall biosynthesis